MEKFAIKYENHMTEDFFNYLIKWIEKTSLNENMYRFTSNNSFEDFKECGYCWYRHQDSSYKGGVDNNSQGLPLCSYEEVCRIIGYNEKSENLSVTDLVEGECYATLSNYKHVFKCAKNKTGCFTSCISLDHKYLFFDLDVGEGPNGYRLATPKEKEHLKQCVEAGKYVEYSETGVKQPKETWCVQITEENRDVVVKWFDQKGKSFSVGAYYGVIDGRKDGYMNCHLFNNNIITTEEFYKKIGHIDKKEEKRVPVFTTSNRYTRGDTVRIIDTGWRYPSYKAAFDLLKWEEDRYDNVSLNATGTITDMIKHEYIDVILLAIVTPEGNILIDENGVELLDSWNETSRIQLIVADSIKERIDCHPDGAAKKETPVLKEVNIELIKVSKLF